MQKTRDHLEKVDYEDAGKINMFKYLRWILWKDNSFEEIWNFRIMCE